MAGTKTFSATLINASALRTSIAIWPQFQGTPDPAPVSWFSALLLSNSYTVLRWQTSYEYVWANTGGLFSDKVVNVAQRLAPTAEAPAARLEQAGTGYRLVPVPSSPIGPDRMLIETSTGVPPGKLAVGINVEIISGIGQPGNAASVVQALPNFSYSWTLGETYYAGFGAIAPSQYDPQALGLQTPLRLDFGVEGDIAVMLDSNNVLIQLDQTEATKLLASGRYETSL